MEPHEYKYKKDHFKKRHRRIAKDAWNEVCASSTHRNYSADYADGFREGFADYLDYGGNGAPPAVPPRKYWNHEFQNPEGHAAIQDWFAGFRHGAGAARDQGVRHWNVMPSSLLPPAQQYVFPTQPLPVVAPPEAIPPGVPPTPIEPPLSLDDLRTSRRQRPTPTRLPTAPAPPMPRPIAKERTTVTERDRAQEHKSASSRIGPGGVFPGIFSVRRTQDGTPGATANPRPIPAIGVADRNMPESQLPLSRMKPSPSLSPGFFDRLKGDDKSRAEGLLALRGRVATKSAEKPEAKSGSKRAKAPTLLDLFVRRTGDDRRKTGNVPFPPSGVAPRQNQNSVSTVSSQSTGPATLLPKDFFARNRSDHAKHADRQPIPGSEQLANRSNAASGKSKGKGSGPFAAFPKLFSASHKKSDKHQAATGSVPNGTATGHGKSAGSESPSNYKAAASGFPQILFASHSGNQSRPNGGSLLPSHDTKPVGKKTSGDKPPSKGTGPAFVFPKIFSTGQASKDKRNASRPNLFGGGAAASQPKRIDKLPKPKQTGPAAILTRIFSTKHVWKRSQGDEQAIVQIAPDYKIESDQSNTYGGL